MESRIGSKAWCATDVVQSDHSQRIILVALRVPMQTAQPPETMATAHAESVLSLGFGSAVRQRQELGEQTSEASVCTAEILLKNGPGIMAKTPL